MKGAQLVLGVGPAELNGVGPSGKPEEGVGELLPEPALCEFPLELDLLLKDPVGEDLRLGPSVVEIDLGEVDVVGALNSARGSAAVSTEAISG